MNPDFLPMLEDCLARGFRVLVLTNAMRPMLRLRDMLLDLNRRRGERLTLRVSLDHYTRELHEDERGLDTWEPTLEGLTWLARNGFKLAIAGRMLWGESETSARQGYAEFFASHDIPIDAEDRTSLVLFPEMDAAVDVPEITDACWDLLHVDPASVMCATSRMVVKRKGAERPAVLACTLLPYDPEFELGADAGGRRRLHPPQPPPLRQVLRAGRRIVQQELAGLADGPPEKIFEDVGRGISSQAGAAIERDLHIGRDR